ncbi:hypothetical protein K3495_g5377 [Podosphaera aphanis]|nr:hypothetical protein K3495_g5377 [Podosphaera aphanis]
MKPRHAVKIQLFQDVIGFVHPFALRKILEEKGKLPRKLTDALPQACICSIEQSMGLSCFHKIHARQRSFCKIALADIDPHWYYHRGGEQPQLERRIMLDPSIVKGKGRLKGNKNRVHQKAKGYGVSSTRRDPSLHEHEMIKPYLNPAISCVIIEDEELSQASQIPATSQTDASKRNTTESYSRLSTTALGITRVAGGVRDPYEAGKVRERAYMRSIKFDKLSSASVEELDSGMFIDTTRKFSSIRLFLCWP